MSGHNVARKNCRFCKGSGMKKTFVDFEMQEVMCHCISSQEDRRMKKSLKRFKI